MLLGFGGRNFYSFREDFDVSLAKKREVLSVLGIKGANASGKTNVIRALSFISSFMFDSFSQFHPENGMFCKSFFDSKEPTLLYIHFKKDGIEYKYEMEFTKEALLREKLSKKESRWTTMLTVENQKIVECTKSLAKIKTINIARDNLSIISLSHQYGFDELKVFYDFASNISSNVTYSGKRTNDEHFINYREISKIYFEDEELLNRIEHFLSVADTGISKIKIREVEDKMTGNLTYEPFFLHTFEDKTFFVHYHDESNGTKMLYRQLAAYFTALQFGSVIAYDEFDIGLHPDIALMLIDLFENNEYGAQLIFTSHYTEVIDKLGKYRLIFVNKEDNESYLYRLDEIPGEILRPDRSIIPAYNTHKIGGRPKVKAYG